MRIVLGVTGSIAAYKAADLVSAFVKEGHEVHVVMSEAATAFITPLTLQVLSKHPVHTDVLVEPNPQRIEHIDLIKDADVLVIAPATANIIGKIANGIADEMVSTVALVGHELKKYIAPAMNTRMYENPIVQGNLSKLKQLGYSVIEPRSTLLACGDVGKGAMATIEAIVAEVL